MNSAAAIATLSVLVAAMALCIAAMCHLIRLVLVDLREERAGNRLFIAGLLDRHATERAVVYDHHRSDTRELLNRLYHPEAMPVAARAPATAQPPAGVETAAARARREFAQVGSVSAIRPQPVAPAPDDDLTPEVP